MQVICERSNSGSDVRCTVCGQGFLVYWERTSTRERALTRHQVQMTLREHHEDEPTGHHAHPRKRFTIPSWTVDPRITCDVLQNAEHFASA